MRRRLVPARTDLAHYLGTTAVPPGASGPDPAEGPAQVAPTQDQGHEREHEIAGGDRRSDFRQEHLEGEQAEEGAGADEGEAEVEEEDDREERLGGGEEDLLPLAGIEREGVGAAEGDAVDERQHADQQGPLVDLGGDEGAERGGALAAP